MAQTAVLTPYSTYVLYVFGYKNNAYHPKKLDLGANRRSTHNKSKSTLKRVLLIRKLAKPIVETGILDGPLAKNFDPQKTKR